MSVMPSHRAGAQEVASFGRGDGGKRLEDDATRLGDEATRLGHRAERPDMDAASHGERGKPLVEAATALSLRAKALGLEEKRRAISDASLRSKQKRLGGMDERRGEDVLPLVHSARSLGER
jgi:hypothetical protein